MLVIKHWYKCGCRVYLWTQNEVSCHPVTMYLVTEITLQSLVDKIRVTQNSLLATFVCVCVWISLSLLSVFLSLSLSHSVPPAPPFPHDLEVDCGVNQLNPIYFFLCFSQPPPLTMGHITELAVHIHAADKGASSQKVWCLWFHCGTVVFYRFSYRLLLLWHLAVSDWLIACMFELRRIYQWFQMPSACLKGYWLCVCVCVSVCVCERERESGREGGVLQY